MEQSMSVELAENMFLTCRRVMGAPRMEIEADGVHNEVLKDLGVFFELIAFRARGFIPTDRFNVLAAVLQRFPIVNIHAQHMVA
jgi:hypothetical protein